PADGARSGAARADPRLGRQGDLGYLPDFLPFRAHLLARPEARRRAAFARDDPCRFSQAGPLRARHDPVPDAPDLQRKGGRLRGRRPLHSAPRMTAGSDRCWRGRGVVKGTATGPALLSATPISFLGDIEIVTGRVVGRSSDLVGACIAGTVLLVPASRGSAGAWRFVYQLRKHRTHP